MNREKIKTKKY